MPDKIAFVSKFSTMLKRADVADLLDISDDQLCFVLYLLEPKYTEFLVKKRLGGTRKISAPNIQLKFIQKRLKTVLQEIYEVKPSVYGFVKGRGILGNAKVHRRKAHVLNLDLNDFFPSIHMGRVSGLFSSQPYNLPDNVAKVLAQICCTYEGLPQGAPTSPIISNMICRKLDAQLQRLAARHKCFYTRYADDITFSTSLTKFPLALASYIDGQLTLGDELNSIIQSNGFQVNPKKLRLRSYSQRQEVTGLVVNRFPNVNRNFIRQVRAIIHHWQKDRENGLTEQSDAKYRAIIHGKLAYIAMVKGRRDNVYRGLVGQIFKIDPLFAKKFKIEAPIKVFINYAREDEVKIHSIVELLKSPLYGFDVWMDRSGIAGGSDWEEKINKEIDTCEVFIACLTPQSVVKDGFVQTEIERAVLRNQLTKKPKIIPFRLEECEIQKTLAKLHYIDYFPKYNLQELKEAISALQEP